MTGRLHGHPGCPMARNFSEECLAATSAESAQQERLPIYWNFQDKMHTFRESRAMTRFKKMSRGYYPMGAIKEKSNGKGKSKGKGFGKKGPFQNSSTSILGREHQPVRSLAVPSIRVLSSAPPKSMTIE